ncbi:MAG: hypothetical protein ABSG32_27995 [Terriglobia bacterium]|jgi:hypothetical protein
MPSDIFIKFSSVMLLNAKCRYRNEPASSDSITHVLPGTLFHFAQSIKNSVVGHFDAVAASLPRQMARKTASTPN